MERQRQYSSRRIRWHAAVARLIVAGSAGCAGLSVMSGGVSAQTVPAEGANRVTPSAARPSSRDSGRANRGEHGLWWSSRYRSPGLAVALSLTPLPVDFGNLYAENLAWGIGYTVVEVCLLAPTMWLTGGHMNHAGDGSRSWSDGERNAMIALVSGYVAVKIGSGIHAGYAARDFSRRAAGPEYATVVPLRRGAALQLGGSF